jgi:hypothetical protein
MEVAGNNVFSLEDYPYPSTDKFCNCQLEEVTLQPECPNCTISLPLGDVPGAVKGSFHHNLVTLVFGTWKETFPCQVRVVGKIEGMLNKGEHSTTIRVRDSHKQLDFIYSSAAVNVCSTARNLSSYNAVLGMEQVIITFQTLPNKIVPTDYFRISGSPKDQHGKPFSLTSHLTRTEIEYASHTQYSRDLAMEVSNRLAKDILNLQCEQRLTTHQTTISTAQYNGWLAAAYLPLCSKLIAIRASAVILRCTTKNYTFEPVFTNSLVEFCRINTGVKLV